MVKDESGQVKQSNGPLVNWRNCSSEYLYVGTSDSNYFLLKEPERLTRWKNW